MDGTGVVAVLVAPGETGYVAELRGTNPECTCSNMLVGIPHGCTFSDQEMKLNIDLARLSCN